MAIELGAAYISILPSTDKLAPGIRKELDRSEGDAKRAGERSGSGFASGLKATLGTALKGGLIAGLAGGSLLGGLGIKTAAEMENAEIAFTTMLGSGRKAKAFIKELTDFAAKTPFEFPGLQTAASSLLSAGIATKDVIPIMTSLGNATSGMGTGAEGVERATVAIQQMNAAGRITGEDLNQLRDAGIPVFDLLAAATGKSKKEVAALAQQGKLGAKELTQLMGALKSGKGLERFNGLMEKQSASLNGMWSTFKDTLGMGLAKAIKPLMPLLKQGLGGAAKALAPALDKVAIGSQKAAVWISKFAREWKAGEGAGGRFREIVHRVADVLGDVLAIGVRVLKWANQHRPIVLGLVAAYVALRVTIVAYNAAQKVAAAGGLASWIKQTRIATAITKGYTAVKWALTGALKAARFALTASTTAVKFLGKAILTTVTATARFLATVIATTARVIAQTVVYLAQKTVMLAMRAATLGWAAAQWALNVALNANPIALVVIGIVALIAILVVAWKKSDTFRRIVTGAFGAVKNAGLKAFGWVKAHWPLLLAILTGPFGLAVLAIVKNWDRIKSGATSAKNFVVGKMNALVGFFKGLPGRMATAVSGLWDGLREGFRSTINTIIGWWNGFSLHLDIPDKIPGLPDDFDIGTPDIPYLAKGGVLTKATLNVAGEAGPEAVIPLDRLDAMLATAGAAGAANEEARRYAKPLVSGEGSGSRRTEFVITNWKTGEGYFREIAEDTYHGENEFAEQTRRMH